MRAWLRFNFSSCTIWSTKLVYKEQCQIFYVNSPIRKYVYNLGRVNRLEIVAFRNIFLLLLYLWGVKYWCQNHLNYLVLSFFQISSLWLTILDYKRFKVYSLCKAKIMLDAIINTGAKINSESFVLNDFLWIT